MAEEIDGDRTAQDAVGELISESGVLQTDQGQHRWGGHISQSSLFSQLPSLSMPALLMACWEYGLPSHPIASSHPGS